MYLYINSQGDNMQKIIKKDSQDKTPNPIDIHVGNRIRLRRRVLDLTQVEIADLLGIRFQQIQKYEKGINRISAGRLWDFACVLGVDINFFYQDIPDDIMHKNPRCLSTNHKIGKVSFEDSNKGMELLRNYQHISSRPEAQHIFALLKSMACSNNECNITD